MTTFIRSAIVAVALLSGVSAASAAPVYTYDSGVSRNDINLNTPEGVKAFWESQTRNGN